MTTLMRRPTRTLAPRLLPQMDRLLTNFWTEPLTFGLTRLIGPEHVAHVPRVDLYETDSELVAKVELPGVKKGDVEVEHEDQHLVIRGRTHTDEEVQEEGLYRRERYHGEFARVVHLPVEIDEENIKATFEDGVLEVRAPKTEPEPQGKKIEIT
jgi:HSP20 family protein